VGFEAHAKGGLDSFMPSQHLSREQHHLLARRALSLDRCCSKEGRGATGRYRGVGQSRPDREPSYNGWAGLGSQGGMAKQDQPGTWLIAALARAPVADRTVCPTQIFATTSLGACHVLYSPSASIHGALLPLNKIPRTTPRNEIFVQRAAPVIITPHALGSMRDQDHRQSKRQKDKARMDPIKSQKPQEPLVGAGKGGRVGASATQHVVQSLFR